MDFQKIAITIPTQKKTSNGSILFPRTIALRSFNVLFPKIRGEKNNANSSNLKTKTDS